MHPIKLLTKFGNDQFNILLSQNLEYEKNGMRDAFQERCGEDFVQQERCIEYFLDDEETSNSYKMNDDDPSGFEIFREQSDLCSCLKYFSERKYNV